MDVDCAALVSVWQPLGEAYVQQGISFSRYDDKRQQRKKGADSAELLSPKKTRSINSFCL